MSMMSMMVVAMLHDVCVLCVQGKKHECGLHVMVIAGVNTTR